jgi:exonuclease III
MHGAELPPGKLRALGYIDSFAAVTCNPQRNYTLHYTMLGFHSGRRIDFIFHDRAFETTESWLSSGQPSDHDPVVSVLGYVRPIEKRLPTAQ